MKNSLVFDPQLSVAPQAVQARMRVLITKDSTSAEDGAVYNLELLAQVQRIRQYLLAFLVVMGVSVAAGVILTIVALNQHQVVNPGY